MNFVSDQQAKSQGTIMFKVIPITERPVHNQTMVINHHLHLPHLEPPVFHSYKPNIVLINVLVWC